MKRAGRPVRWTPAKVATLISMASRGESIEEISAATGMSHGAVSEKRRSLRQRGEIAEPIRAGGWTDDMERELRRMWAEGYSCSAIGRQVGTTKNGVISKARRLRLLPQVRVAGPNYDERRRQAQEHRLMLLEPPKLPPGLTRREAIQALLPSQQRRAA